MIDLDPPHPLIQLHPHRTSIDPALHPLLVRSVQAPLQQTATDTFPPILGQRDEEAHEEKVLAFHVHVALFVHGPKEVFAQGRVGALGPLLGPARLIRRHAVDVEVPPRPGDDAVGAGVGGFDEAGAGVGVEEVRVLRGAVLHGLLAGVAEGHGEVGFEGYVLDVGEAGEVGVGGYRGDGVGAGGEVGRCVGRRGGVGHADVGGWFGDADGG